MPSADDRSERLLLLSVPSLLFVIGCGMSLLPVPAIAHVLTLLVLWTSLSIPLAVLIGHCMLSEE